MRNFFALIIVLLVTLCLFSCADNDAGDTPDVMETTESVVTTAPDETDEPDTKVDYLTSVDEEVNGFSVKGQKYYYEYNDEDFLIFDVENLTDKISTVEIAVTFYDKNGNEVAKETEHFPDLVPDGTQTLIFRPYKDFEGFTYELTATEFTEIPSFEYLVFDIKGACVKDITDRVSGNTVPSFCMDFYSALENDDMIGIGYNLTVAAFDENGQVQGVATLIDASFKKGSDKSLFFRVLSEDEEINAEEYSFKVMFADLMYTYINEGSAGEQPSVEEEPENLELFDDDFIKNYDEENTCENGFIVKAKKYTHDGKDVLLFKFENPTDKTYAATITVNYFDENGERIKTQVQNYDWFSSGYYKYFIFRPGKTFKGYSYDIEFTEVEEEVPLITCGVIGRTVRGFSVRNGDESLLSTCVTYDFCVKNEGGLPVQLVICCLEFDESGELFDIRNAGQSVRLTERDYIDNSFMGYDLSSDGAESAYRFDKGSKCLIVILDAEIVEKS